MEEQQPISYPAFMRSNCAKCEKYQHTANYLSEEGTYPETGTCPIELEITLAHCMGIVDNLKVWGILGTNSIEQALPRTCPKFAEIGSSRHQPTAANQLQLF